MSKNPVIYVMVGVPGSGKSTYREALIKEYENDAVVVSTDDYIEWFAKQTSSTYSDVFEFAIGPANSIANDLLDFAITNKKTIIWDQTNLTEKKRRSILSRIPNNYWKIAVHFNVDLETALENNAKRERKIPNSVIEQMFSYQTTPKTSEGFNEISMVF